MRLSIFSFVLTILAPSAQALDSSWLLCHGDEVAVNVYEHRAGADVRETSLTLIYGGHILAGDLVDELSGPVALSDVHGTDNAFQGSVSVDLQHDRMRIDGDLTLFGDALPVHQDLSCVRMH